MSRNLELCNAIECFVDKYWQIPEKVEWPKWEFEIVGVCQVNIDKDSLEEIDSLWTFKGSALIATTDSSKVTLRKKYTIIGNTVTNISLNRNNNEKYYSTVERVIITKIEN